VLIQRGKGGGLAGAFGGVGGSSAFGTKAGDVFTRITVGIAIAWILLSMLMVILTNRHNESAWGSDAVSRPTDTFGTGVPRPKKGSSDAKSGKEAVPPPPSPASSPRSGPAESPLPADFPPIPAIPEPSSTPAPK